MKRFAYVVGILLIALTTYAAWKHNPFTGKMDYYEASSGSGDVTGPSSSTDNHIATFDSTTGKIIQDNTGVTVNDSGYFNPGDTPGVTGHHNTDDEDVFYFGMESGSKAATEADTILQGFTGNAKSTFLTHDGGLDEIQTTKDFTSTADIQAYKIDAGVAIDVNAGSPVTVSGNSHYYLNSGTYTYNLPASPITETGVGKRFCFSVRGANVLTIDPNGTDIINHAGLGSLGAGVAIDNSTSSAAGDFICLVGYDASTWYSIEYGGTWDGP